MRQSLEYLVRSLKLLPVCDMLGLTAARQIHEWKHSHAHQLCVYVENAQRRLSYCVLNSHTPYTESNSLTPCLVHSTYNSAPYRLHPLYSMPTNPAVHGTSTYLFYLLFSMTSSFQKLFHESHDILNLNEVSLSEHHTGMKVVVIIRKQRHQMFSCSIYYIYHTRSNYSNSQK